jgi:hypothetical protein
LDNQRPPVEVEYYYVLMKPYFFFALLLVSLISCVYHDTREPVDCEASQLSVTLDSVATAANCSSGDGAIYVQASGGEEPYTFFLNAEENQNGSFTGLAPGIYSIRLVDFNGCETSLDNVTVMAEDFSFSAIFEEDTECLTDNGSVTIEVVDGNPPYQFKIANGIFADINTFSGLATGNHVVQVKDNDDCIISLNLTVPRGNTGVSWSTEIKPLMETYCATSRCHNGVARSNDFRNYATVKFYAKTIRSKTQDRSMPFDEALTQEQIDIIACWVDDGAIEN